MKNFLKKLRQSSLITVLITIVIASGLQAQTAKWTFMVYLGADCDLEPFGIIDFNEMESVGSDSDVQIIVQMDRIPGYDNSNGNWTDTRRFRVIQDDNTSTISSPVVQNLGEVNMGDPEKLKEFIMWASANYPAQHYALVLWNHGGGWQKQLSGAKLKKIIDELQQNPANPNRTDELASSFTIRPDGVFPANPFLNGFGPFRDVVFDQTDNDHLGNAEISAAIGASGINMDIVGFDACLMGMIENSYQLRNVSQIVVGSEETEPGDGWPYHTILSQLKNNPDMSAEELAATIVNKYGNSYPGEAKITQSAVKTTGILDVAQQLDAFTGAIIQNNLVWSQVDQARVNSERFTIPEHRDLAHFVQNVKALVNDTQIDAAADDLLTAISDAVIENYTGSGFPNSKGIAIYFPDASNYNSGYGLGNYNIDFPQNTQWVDFLQATFNGGSGGGSTPDDYEPNDVWALAYGPVENGKAIDSYISSSDDIDMFRLLNGSLSQITIDLTVPADYDLYLFSLNGAEMTLIAGSDQYGTVNEQIIIELPEGVYYAIVLAYDEVSEQPYQLLVDGLGINPSTIFDATLAFDYGEAEYQAYSEGEGDALVCIFDPPVAPAKLEKIWIYLKDTDGAQTGGNGSFYMFAYDYYDFLFDPEYLTPPDTGWLYYDLTAAGIYIYGNFAVGMMYDGVNTPAIGYDEISSYGNNLFYIAEEDQWYEDEGTYYVRAEVKFTNPTAGTEERKIISPSSVTCSPNPFDNYIILRFDPGVETISEIEISDITGKVLIRHTGTIFTGSNYHLKLKAERLEPGVYLCKVRTNKGVMTSKLIKR